MSEREDVVETIAVETVAVTTPAAVEAAAGDATEELGKVRELVLKAHPDVVPDLVRGELGRRADRLGRAGPQRLPAHRRAGRGSSREVERSRSREVDRRRRHDRRSCSHRRCRPAVRQRRRSGQSGADHQDRAGAGRAEETRVRRECETVEESRPASCYSLRLSVRLPRRSDRLQSEPGGPTPWP